MTPKQVLQQLGVIVAPDGHHHVSSDWLGVDCPACSPGSGRFRLGLRFPNAASCWTCGPVRLWAVLQELTNLDWRGVKEAFSGVEVVYKSEPARNRSRIAFTPLPGVGRLLAPHKRYLRGRGLSCEELEGVWGVGGIGIAARNSWSIYIPIREGKTPVSWTCRSISEESGWRYDSAKPSEEAVNHKSLLFGEELARHAIVINEGPLDAMSLGPGGVATFGLAWTQAQLLRMSKYPIRVVCFDAEKAAQLRAEKLMCDLAVFPGSTYNIVLETGKDPASASKKERSLIKKTFLK